MKRIIIKKNPPSLKVHGTFRKASYRWDADIFSDKEKLFRKRDNRLATKTVGDESDDMQRK